MRVFISLLFVLVLGIGVGVGVGFKMLPSSGGGGVLEPATRKIAYWAAPMDPDFRRDEPGQSPMGMDLVPVYEDELNGGGSNAPEGAIKIDPIYVHTLGVKTALAQQRDFGRNILAFGRVVPNTRSEQRIDIRSEGWISKLETNAVGDPVKKGDLLFTFYSPDLVIAESDYLLQIKGGKVFGNPELRLGLEGMDDIAIAQLKKKRELIYKVPFHAPADGTVSMLNVREGSFVGEGETVMVIDDFSSVWVNADIPIKDMPFLKIGDSAVVTLPDIGRSFPAIIDFIHPVLNGDNRTGIVRLVLENTDTLLHPDHYVDVVFTSESAPRLAVPREAVIYSADGAHVFESLGDGLFNPVMVDVGITANGLSEIKSGLEAGQKVVTSGQFMLDAESNLKGGMDSMKSAGGHDHGK